MSSSLSTTIEFTSQETTTLFKLCKNKTFKTHILSHSPLRTKWSRSIIESVIKNGQASVNNNVIKFKGNPIVPGDHITINLYPTLNQQAMERKKLATEQIEILFEDVDLIVLSVQAGVGAKHLIHFVLPELYGEESAANCRIVSRSYRAVSGLVLIAKSAQIATVLNTTLQMTFRGLICCLGGVIAHGDFCLRTKVKVKQDQEDQEDQEDQDQTGPKIDKKIKIEQKQLQKHRSVVTIIDSVPSNACLRLLLVDLDHVDELPIKHQFRKQLHLAKFPIIGSLVHAHKLNGVNQSICQMLQQITFVHPTSQEPMCFKMDSNNPTNTFFRTIMTREKHFATSKSKKLTANEIYQIGTCTFMNYTFNVTPSVLIPRESSSTVVKVALDYVKEHATIKPSSLNILDLGTGSGCLLIALLIRLDELEKEMMTTDETADEKDIQVDTDTVDAVDAVDAIDTVETKDILQNVTNNTDESKHSLVSTIKSTGTGMDMYPSALDVALSNVKTHRLEQRVTLVQGTFTHPGQIISSDLYDIILCNPPYRTKTAAKTKLDYQIKSSEPNTALIVYGNDGLLHYREVISLCVSVLKPGTGLLVFETPSDLSKGVQNILLENGSYTNVNIVTDDKNRIRCVTAQLS